jgi:mannose-6-phosphate isomerase-like protein (cupin superfamily)
MSLPSDFSAPGRRVVTGVNELGKSVIVSDGPVPEKATWVSELACGGDVWVENNVPVDLNAPIADYALQDWPSPGGVIVRMITWQPGFSIPMHRSNTIDIGVIVSGKVEFILDEVSTILQAGDVAIGRGANHGFRVVGDEPCTLFGVMLDAIPSSTPNNVSV